MFLALTVGAADPPRKVHPIELHKLGTIPHLDNFASVTAWYDHPRATACLSVTVTRKEAGSDTITRCHRGSRLPMVKIEPIGVVPHGDNSVTHFRLFDEANDRACYGTIVTRTEAGAALSMDCP